MIDRFLKFIAANNLVSHDDKILLAVSGGIDSMVMAHLFGIQKYSTGIAHCNFGLRGAESDKDEELVRKFASDHNLPFHTIRFDTQTYARKKKLSVQMAARELRYNWFEEIMEEYGYNLIAIAHNLNDNIETLLINLVRGTGMAGLAGMKPVAKRIIRPLLFATRQEISDYRDANNIIYREDKSNADTKYIRNKIRHLVVPLLREINPSIETTLNDTAERFSGLNEIVQEFITGLRENLTEERENVTAFNIAGVRSYLHNKSVIFELFRPFSITNALLTDLAKIIDGSTGGQVITETHRIFKDRRELIVTPLTIRDEVIFTINRIEEFSAFPGISSARKITVSETYEIPEESHIACIDYNKVSFPMTIRKWKAGDHFYPLGMNRKKKLSDYFIDNKYSLLEKENIYILESDGKIIWIIGGRIDNRFKITSSTKKALLIKSKKKAMVIKPVR
jgi:tRNA(Ile)-lysidine synthase